MNPHLHQQMLPINPIQSRFQIDLFKCLYILIHVTRFEEQATQHLSVSFLFTLTSSCFLYLLCLLFTTNFRSNPQRIRFTFHRVPPRFETSLVSVFMKKLVLSNISNSTNVSSTCRYTLTYLSYNTHPISLILFYSKF